MPETDNGIVYHYCSLETFKGIIENKCLWLCDVRKSNDNKECLALPEKIYEISNQMQIIEKCPEEQRPALERIFRFFLKNPVAVYTACFTKKRDDLNQWRGYAADGTGLCIGFRKKYFCALNSSVDGFLKYRTVKYHNSHLEKTATSFAKKLENLKNELCKYNFTIPDMYTLWASNSFMRQVWEKSPEYKKIPFKEEAEQRIIFLPKISTSDYREVKLQKNSMFIKMDSSVNRKLALSEIGFGLSNLKYRISRGTLQGYYELSFDSIADDLIAEIIIGPKCPLTEEDIFLFLAANQYYRHIKRDDPNDVSRFVFPKDLLNVCTSALSYR